MGKPSKMNGKKSYTKSTTKSSISNISETHDQICHIHLQLTTRIFGSRNIEILDQRLKDFVKMMTG